MLTLHSQNSLQPFRNWHGNGYSHVSQVVMDYESELERLQRQVEKAKALVRQSGMKVEELDATVQEICRFKDRLTTFPRNGQRTCPGTTDGPASFKDRDMTSPVS